MTINATLFPGITYADCAAEIARELDHRRHTYPDRVAANRMKQADAQYQLDIFDCIRLDVDRMAHSGPEPEPAPAHLFTWAERRKALQRELDYRARLYPEWIKGGRMTQHRADAQVQRLKAVLWRYDAGFDWVPENPAKRMEEARAIWRYPDGPYHQKYNPGAEPPQAALGL